MAAKKAKRKSRIKKMKGTAFGVNPFQKLTPRHMRTSGPRKTPGTRMRNRR